MRWYITVLKKYAVFRGRARRREYWMFMLFSWIFTVIAMILDNVFNIAIENLFYGPIYILYMLAVLVPILSVTVRRLHDTGKSGWYWLVYLIPIAGPIWLLVLMCLDGTPGENKYGPNPKEIS